MNCYGPKELAESFRTVRKNTIRIAEDIPEEKYGFRAAPGHALRRRVTRSYFAGLRFSVPGSCPGGAEVARRF